MPGNGMPPIEDEHRAGVDRHVDRLRNQYDALYGLSQQKKDAWEGAIQAARAEIQEIKDNNPQPDHIQNRTIARHNYLIELAQIELRLLCEIEEKSQRPQSGETSQQGAKGSYGPTRGAQGAEKGRR